MTNILSSRGIHGYYSPQIFWQRPISLDIQVSSLAWNNIMHSSTSTCCITFCFLLYPIACLPLPSQMFSSLNIVNHLLICFLFIFSLLSFILLHYFNYISSSFFLNLPLLLFLKASFTFSAMYPISSSPNSQVTLWLFGQILLECQLHTEEHPLAK